MQQNNQKLLAGHLSHKGLRQLHTKPRELHPVDMKVVLEDTRAGARCGGQERKL